MEIKFVQLKLGCFIPYNMRKASESETVVQFWAPTLAVQTLHNGRFHCNLMTSSWYRDIPRNLGIQHKFHQAGFDPSKEFNFSKEPPFNSSKIDDNMEFFHKYQIAYNRVELFGDNITEETVERYLVTYLSN